MVRLLLDTHIFLWVVNQSPRLNAKTRSFLESAAAIYVSSASIWEIAIKRGLRSPDFQHNPREIRQYLLRNGCEELPIQSRHVVEVDSLPPIHKDPFDRILIAQAMVEGITLLTADAVIAQYPGPICKV